MKRTKEINIIGKIQSSESLKVNEFFLLSLGDHEQINPFSRDETFWIWAILSYIACNITSAFSTFHHSKKFGNQGKQFNIYDSHRISTHLIVDNSEICIAAEKKKTLDAVHDLRIIPVVQL